MFQYSGMPGWNPCKPHAEVTSGFLNNNTPGWTRHCVNDVPGGGGSEKHENFDIFQVFPEWHEKSDIFRGSLKKFLKAKKSDF